MIEIYFLTGYGKTIGTIYYGVLVEASVVAGNPD
jgi:hypothetical protein